MEFDDVILGRRSIRGYLKKPVPKALVREVLEVAMRAPTSLNTQPWNFYVVAGAVLDRIRKGNVERNLAGVPHSREFRMGPGYEGAHREREVHPGLRVTEFGLQDVRDMWDEQFGRDAHPAVALRSALAV